jgi:hypothetical protein
VDAVLVDIAGVDATGLIRYRLHDLLRAFARECLLAAEPPGVRESAQAEALAWGGYPYDSAPAGTAIRPLARPFPAEDRPVRGDRAWLAGSLALSAPDARKAYLRHAPEHELAGAPETDLRFRDFTGASHS